MARIVPYAAVHFGAYEWYRQALVDRLAAHGPGAAPPSPGWDLLAGSAAGGTAVLATYPLDLVRVLPSGLWRCSCVPHACGRSSTVGAYRTPVSALLHRICAPPLHYNSGQEHLSKHAIDLE